MQTNRDYGNGSKYSKIKKAALVTKVGGLAHFTASYQVVLSCLTSYLQLGNSS